MSPENQSTANQTIRNSQDNAGSNGDKLDNKEKIKRWKEVEEYLPHWQALAQTSEEAHYDSSRYYLRWNRWLGIPVILLTTFVGGSVFATYDTPTTDYRIKIFLSVISVVAAALSALQTFLHYGELVEKHHKAAAGYGAVHLDIECAKFTPIEERDDPKRLINDLKTQIESLEKDSPEFPEYVWKKYKRKFEADKKILA